MKKLFALVTSFVMLAGLAALSPVSAQACSLCSSHKQSHRGYKDYGRHKDYGRKHYDRKNYGRNYRHDFKNYRGYGHRNYRSYGKYKDHGQKNYWHGYNRSGHRGHK